MRFRGWWIVLIAGLFVLIHSCGAFHGAKKETAGETRGNKALYVEYDVYSRRLESMNFLTKQHGVLINEGKRSQFSWAFGEKGRVTVEVDGRKDGWYQDEVGNVVLKDFESDSVQQRFIYYDVPYCTAIKLDPIQWKIEKQTKQVGNFTCKKATCRYKGREYTAWFTPEIPISDGPWKLHGLPGLILEAEDSKGEFKYKLKRVVYPYSGKAIVDTIPCDNWVDSLTFYNGGEIEAVKIEKMNLAAHEGGGEFRVRVFRYIPQEIGDVQKDRDGDKR